MTGLGFICFGPPVVVKSAPGLRLTQVLMGTYYYPANAVVDPVNAARQAAGLTPHNQTL